MTRRLGIAAAIAALIALVAPASALARTDVSYSPTSGLLITASTRVNLGLHVRNDQGVLEWDVSQFGLPSDISLVAGLGCRQAGPFDVFCHPTGSRAVNATLSDDSSPAGETLQVDEVQLAGLLSDPGTFTSSVTIDGRGGRDDLQGSRGPDVLRGGGGNDLLQPDLGNDVAEGGAGDDTIFATNFGTMANVQSVGPNGADVYRGGPDEDFVSYFGRREPVVVSLDGQANDGAAGENDNVGPDNDVENLGAGATNSTLIGNDGPNRFQGNVGNDTLRGLGGNDILRGGVLGDDNLDGGAGDDTLVGDTGIDELVGGPGADTINARDGERDHTILCSGRDTVELDLKDSDPKGTCLSISRFPVDVGAVEILSQRPRLHRGALKLVMRCPKRNEGACAGKLRVARPGGRSSRAASYRIRRGHRATVAVALRASDVARLKASSGGTVVATSVEEPKSGTETVSRRISVRG